MTLVDSIRRLQLGDPLLVLDWSDEALQICAAQDPTHTKATLVAHIVANGGLNQQGSDYIFSFSDAVTYSACQDAAPLWAKSPGPITIALYFPGEAAPQPVAIAHFITGTTRVVPDIMKVPLF